MSTETIIKVELATSEALYKGAMAIRKQVFVKEQRIPESKEFDGNDFCAAHVVAYVQKKDGDVVERGKHAELLAKNGFYAEIYRSQFS